MPQDPVPAPTHPLETEAHAFATAYAALFSSPLAATAPGIPDVAAQVARKYRRGVTFFTNGAIARLETREQAGALIEAEMRTALGDGLGVCLLLRDVRVEAYSETAATCWLTWTFQPPEGSEFADRPWTFVNIYGYRAAGMGDGEEAGWEYVVRDHEVNEMKRVTGKVFN